MHFGKIEAEKEVKCGLFAFLGRLLSIKAHWLIKDELSSAITILESVACTHLKNQQAQAARTNGGDGGGSTWRSSEVDNLV